jgi:ABC-type polysaccharide/polyol phosphate transport system ATPase subunit
MCSRSMRSRVGFAVLAPVESATIVLDNILSLGVFPQLVPIS